MGYKGNIGCTLNTLHWPLGKSHFAGSQHGGSAAGLELAQFSLTPNQPPGVSKTSAGPPLNGIPFCWVASTGSLNWRQQTMLVSVAQTPAGLNDICR